MVLFIFVIMLLNLHPSELGSPQITVLKGIGCALAASGLIMMAVRFWPVGGSFPPVDAKYGTLEQVGRALFSSYLLPFEVISILLTAAVVGAVVIAKRDL
jgi:NADH-quinone oxidoreductase subunit J